MINIRVISQNKVEVYRVCKDGSSRYIGAATGNIQSGWFYRREPGDPGHLKFNNLDQLMGYCWSLANGNNVMQDVK